MISHFSVRHENYKKGGVKKACSTEINLTITEEADAIVKNVGFQDSSKTSVNNDTIREQETHRQSHEGVGEVRIVDSLSSRSPGYQNQPFIKVIETDKNKVTAPKLYTCQSDNESSDTDLFMNNTEQEDNNVDLLSDLSNDSWIIGSSKSAQRISKHSEDNSRSLRNEVSSSNRLRRISEKMCVRFERDTCITNIETDSKSSPLAYEYREYCSSPNGDSDFLEVCVNEQFDVREVGSVKRDIDVEMVTSSYDEAGQIRYSNPSNRKQDEIAMSPELISDDDEDNIITSKNGYHSHEGEANAVKHPQELISNTLMDFTTDTSGDDLPSVSFSTHQLRTSRHSHFDQSTDQIVILDGTKNAVINLNSPEPISPVFGKRKMFTDQTSTKCIRLNYDSESKDTTISNDPVAVPISKKSKFKFKMRDKSQTTSRPVANVENSESKTNKDNFFTNDAASRYQLKPKKRFSQLWVKNINQTCSKKKKSLFSFGITGCKKDEERKVAKEIETINLLDDEYESELEEGVLKVRNIDGLNLEAIAFIVWKNQQYLRDIFQGKSHFSVRHENYKKGGVKKADLDFKVPLHMFSDEQVETVIEILVKIFCSRGTKYWDYVMKVLLAEALIKIYMDIHHINYNEAQEIIDNMKNSQEYLQ
ncbi:uncharacterized protein LOC117103544 [Anneissia japonica]|uniref:uncharacterized protein LOC117103544 n=1 Tax=Anneissia japonica TaxID=1529436 RepID=UPI0014259DB2|nr:uncharacterized protein LOC117103544 [Anneissia japonica]